MLERLTVIVDNLAVKPCLTAEKNRLLELLATLIEVYENEHHELPDAAAARDDSGLYATTRPMQLKTNKDTQKDVFVICPSGSSENI